MWLGALAYATHGPSNGNVCFIANPKSGVDGVALSGVQWLRGRASDSRLQEPGFESCAAVLKPWASFFTRHCSSSLSCINEYLTMDNWWISVRAAFAH